MGKLGWDLLHLLSLGTDLGCSVLPHYHHDPNSGIQGSIWGLEMAEATGLVTHNSCSLATGCAGVECPAEDPVIGRLVPDGGAM